MVFNNNLLLGAAGQGGGYEIDQSIRFNAEDSAYLEKTYSSSESTLTAWSFSTWVKRSKLGAEQFIFLAGTTSANLEYLRFTSGDQIEYKLLLASSLDSNYITSQLFRDPGAWMHIYAYRSSTTFKLYINGSEVTDFGTSNAPGSSNGILGSNVRHRIGTSYSTPSNYLGTYLAEINFVPGTAMAATDFGETNDDGVWIPKAYTGSYGTNGFYITGETASDLGEDFSGNNNDFTSSGLATTDQMLDTPTLNASTFNPLWAGAGLSDGNLVATATGNTYQWATSTFAIDDGGKYVCEFQKSAGTFGYVGIFQIGNHTATTGNNYMYAINVGTGEVVKNASVLVDVGAAPANSLMRIEYDGSNDTIKIFDDGAETFPASTGVSNTVGLTGQNSLHFGCAPYGSGTVITATFQGLSGTPTADFLELTSANLATPSITDGSAHFQPTLYTGNSSTLEVNQSGNSTFQPDWLWVKSRSLGSGGNHVSYDAVRGVTKEIYPNLTNAEGTTSALTSFDADGFTLSGAASGSERFNKSGETYVAWQWKANGAGSSNEDGSINTTATSVNTTAGFSISTYTGNGTSGATFGHGLGVAPKMVIVKERSPGGNNWMVGHDSLGWTKYIALDTTAAAVTSSTRWNNTAPSSTVVTLGNDTGINENTATYVAYCFAEIPGYSSIGVYTGNGSTNGPFVYTGFKPAYVILKRTNATQEWQTYDTQRDPYNVTNHKLEPNSSNAESTSTSDNELDFLSNSFKLREDNGGMNASGSTYIYMAFAENPFGGDGAAPATAR
jgi:hypothetical protein